MDTVTPTPDEQHQPEQQQSDDAVQGVAKEVAAPEQTSGPNGPKVEPSQDIARHQPIHVSAESLKGRVHPYAELYPLAMNHEFLGSVKENGVQVPIVLLDGLVLDGRRRLTAALAAGLRTVPTVEYAGDDPLLYVLVQNRPWRKLTTDQKVALAKRVMPLLKGRAERNRKAGVALGPNDPKGRATELAATMAGTSASSLKRSLQVDAEAPDLAEGVKAGRITGSAAYRKLADRRLGFVVTETEEQRHARLTNGLQDALERTIKTRTDFVWHRYDGTGPFGGCLTVARREGDRVTLIGLDCRAGARQVVTLDPHRGVFVAAAELRAIADALDAATDGGAR